MRKGLAVKRFSAAFLVAFLVLALVSPAWAQTVGGVEATPAAAVTISGKAAIMNGSGLDGVTLTFSNGGGDAVTSGGGYYSKQVNSGWSGRVTSSYSNPHYLFDPPYRDYSNVTTNQTNQDYGLGHGTVFLTGGNLNGTSLSQTSRVVNVNPGAAISGNVAIQCDNHMPGSSVAPLCYTWFWGKRTASLSTINGSISSGVTNWTVPINLTAPTTPGDYWIVFAFHGEYTAEEICSLTNWSYSGGPVWNDGNDIWDCTSATIDSFNNIGAYWTSMLFPSGYVPVWQPATAVKIHVSSTTVAISGKLTGCSGQALDGVTLTFSNGGGEAVTSGGGYYSKQVNTSWSGRVTPSYNNPNYLFHPLYRDYSNVTSDQTNQDYYSGIGTVFLTGGSLNGTPLSHASRVVNVNPGAAISGNVAIQCDNLMSTSGVAPLCYTWFWGNRTTSLTLINGWINTGVTNWTVPVNLTAPTAPGDYWIVFAFHGQFNSAQICSCTSWSYSGGSVWNDGNDIWDWSQVAIDQTNTLGAAYVDYLYPAGDGGMKKFWCPATAVKIRVTTSSPSPTPPGPPPFSDIDSSYWAYQSCATLYDQGILQGYPDNTCRPLDPVTRAEYVTFLCRYAGIKESYPTNPTFPDVPKAHWAYGYIEAGYQAGLLKGFPDGYFRPQDIVSRIQVLAVMVRLKQWEPLYPSSPTFQDLAGNHWGFPFAEAARENGLVMKPDNPPHIVTTDGNILPDQSAPRD
ncbi:MAG: S-layer homology domain-containing protein, partial [Deltaproteobacteria bacterium]